MEVSAYLAKEADCDQIKRANTIKDLRSKCDQISHQLGQDHAKLSHFEWWILYQADALAEELAKIN